MYHGLFEKNYELNSQEGFRKYKAFKDNIKYIKDFNSKNTKSQLGIGPWTDLSNEEYINTVLTHPDVMKANMESSMRELIEKEESSGLGYNDSETSQPKKLLRL